MSDPVAMPPREALEASFDGLNSTVADQSFSSYFKYVQDLDFLVLETNLILSAMGIIYIGAHAALRRPPSAAQPKSDECGKDCKGCKHCKKDREDERFAQGLEPSDAIMFPVMAGIVLVSLYYLMQWLQDPNILNKIIRYYMSTMSIASLLSLYSHGLEFVTTLLFPSFWRGRDGSIRQVNQKTRSVQVCDDVGNPASGDKAASNNPLPGFLSWLAPTERVRKAAWDGRDLLTRQWVVKLFIHGMGKEEGKIKFAHMAALVMALGTAIAYSSTSSPFLSNMLGYGMCYGSFQLLSPTDYLTSTLVLVGLFFYDIVMVFYTPYMVTVATKLDAPIKLAFEAGERKSILGLGDIVIPGMVMALALRFDLWMHYSRKIKYETTDLKVVEKDAISGEIVTRNDVKHKEVKARYVNAKGNWGDRLWVRGTMFLRRPKQLPPAIEASQFPKTYFIASMVGYLLGMLVTLAMLLVFKRGQPALLYLVPGVLGSLWLTGLVRGEIRQMWTYTEDGSIDTIDVVVDLDGGGNPIKTIGELKDGVVDTTKSKDKGEDKDKDEEAKKKEEEEKRGSTTDGHKVFLFSVETE